MKKFNLLYYFILLSLFSCSNQSNGLEESQNNYLYLKEKFEGKYRLISCNSDSLIDVNLDNTKTRDLLNEIPPLKTADLEIRIQKGKIKDQGYLAVLNQKWPEQVLTIDGEIKRPENITNYDDNIKISYLIQSVSRIVDIKGNNILIVPNQQFGSNQYRLTIPNNILILENQIQVTSNRKVYTIDGMKEVKIISAYRKYTSEI